MASRSSAKPYAIRASSSPAARRAPRARRQWRNATTRATGATRNSWTAVGRPGPVTVVTAWARSGPLRELGHAVSQASLPGVAREVLVQEERPRPAHEMAAGMMRDLHGHRDRARHLAREPYHPAGEIGRASCRERV